MTLGRRLFLGGFAAAGLTALAWYETRPDMPPHSPRRFVFLRNEDRAIVAALAPVMTGVPLASASVVPNLDLAISGLPLTTRRQLRQLFDLLGAPLTRLLVAGIPVPWHAARPETIAAFLQDWRASPFLRLRAAYDALHQLIMAAYYSDDATWQQIGYAGPPRLR